MMEHLYRLLCIADNILPKTDCYIVLSYAVKPNEPTRPTRALIKEVKRRMKSSFSKVIMSTGDNQFLGKPNSVIMKQYGVRIGIKPSHILEEDRSMNTYENLVYSKQILDRYRFRNPTLVCVDLHTRRAVTIAKKLGWRNFGWISVYSQGEGAYGYKWIQTCGRLTIFVYELLATVYCRIRGQL